MFMASQPPYGYKKDPNDKNIEQIINDIKIIDY